MWLTVESAVEIQTEFSEVKLMSDFDNPTNLIQPGGGVGQSPGAGCRDGAFVARRRQLAKLGFGVPVLATLASRPVFAGQCMSNMMSGNLSDPNRGNCAKGSSPGGWAEPGGKVQNLPTVVAWQTVGLLYGSLKSGGKSNKYEDYTGGATLGNVPGVLNKDGMPTSTLLREVLTNLQLGQLTRHFVCAYLNAQLSALGGSTFTYILTTQQVLDMASGAIGIPPSAPGYPGNFNTFLDSTWL